MLAGMKIWLSPLVFLAFYGFALECPVDGLAMYTWGNDGGNEYIKVNAERSRLEQHKASLSGDVVIKQQQDVFHGERLNYDRRTGVVSTPDGITFGTPAFAIRARQADYSTADKTGNFSGVDYYLRSDAAVGSAKGLRVDRDKQTEDLTEASYTTCRRQHPEWSFKARKIHLDHRLGTGRAWRTKFYIGDTPVFYLPYFSFPLDDRRKTGFLFPTLRTSTYRGVDLTVPFYLNIAPNQDATIAMRSMTKRGVMLKGQYRYLLTEHQGEIDGAYLQHDRKSNKKRWAFKVHHTYTPSDQFNIVADYERLSDKNYIKDFTDTLDLSSRNFLKSSITASYKFSSNYSVLAQAQNYQLASSAYRDADKPYNILPKITGVGNWQLGDGFSLLANSEVVNFDKDNAVSGVRFDQHVGLLYDYKKTYMFVRPRLDYRFTHYQLRHQAEDTPAVINRSIPTFSLDSGLYFERPASWFGHPVKQKLEPRLFYLRTPYKYQTKIPDFDTADIDVSYHSLFLTNRFTGKDRIGDADQLAMAVSTSYVDDDSGKEIATLAIGQIQYFADRRVSLNNSVTKRSRSDVIVTGKMKLGEHVNIAGMVQKDIDGKSTRKSLLSVNYSPDSDKAFKLSHLYDSGHYKQLDFSGFWRLKPKWRMFWRWNYSLAYKKSVDIFAGLEYADCCWGVRFIARQQRGDLSHDEADTSVLLEFALKGLGNIGNDTKALLKNVIPSYQPISYERVKR